jgi:hypothetical protein
LIDDLCPSWRLDDWCVTCTACLYRVPELAFEQLPPEYWRLECGDLSVWAWNRDHLAFIAAFLRADETADKSPYAWFGAYVPGEWKSDAARVAKAIALKLGSST